MKIILVGYGKMGREVERIAQSRGHIIIGHIDLDNLSDLDTLTADVAIEFTTPKSAYDNVRKCLERGIRVVSGTTGWYDRLPELETLCKELNGGMLCTSNFSLGVNLFFELNKHLARLMANQQSYELTIEETHHLAKVDAPSGTAVTLAEQQLAESKIYKTWYLAEKRLRNQEGDITECYTLPKGHTLETTLPIFTCRAGQHSGIHSVQFTSDIDSIEIKHTANSRAGFALGAVLAAEFIHNKQGVFSMRQVLGLE